MTKPRAMLFDLDGVLYQADTPISGAAEVIAWVQKSTIPHLFLTNTTSKPRSAIIEKLAAFGIRTDIDNILTPPVATVQWLISQQIEGTIALFVPEATKQEFSSLKIGEEHDVSAVVVGDLGEAWDFAILNKAFRLLMHTPTPKLVALGMTRFWQANDGLRLDVGAFISALEYATDQQAVVMGKPSIEYYKTALSILGCEARHVVMIGDDIKGDIEGAQIAGLQSILVRTGKFREQDLELGVMPTEVLNSVADLPQWWESH